MGPLGQERGGVVDVVHEVSPAADSFAPEYNIVPLPGRVLDRKECKGGLHYRFQSRLG
jgi:hypothetical protein